MEITEVLEKEPRYRAPSWSWACLNGSIAWYRHIITRVDRDLVVLSCLVEPEYSSAPYGAVKPGSLAILGHLNSVQLPQ